MTHRDRSEEHQPYYRMQNCKLSAKIAKIINLPNEPERCEDGQPWQLRSAGASAVPVLVDTMDNQADDAYAGWPDRLYVIDAAGAVVHKSHFALEGFRPAVSAAPFILYKLTDKQ